MAQRHWFLQSVNQKLEWYVGSRQLYSKEAKNHNLLTINQFQTFWYVLFGCYAILLIPITSAVRRDCRFLLEDQNQITGRMPMSTSLSANPATLADAFEVKRSWWMLTIHHQTGHLISKRTHARKRLIICDILSTSRVFISWWTERVVDRPFFS